MQILKIFSEKIFLVVEKYELFVKVVKVVIVSKHVFVLNLCKNKSGRITKTLDIK